ncbi:MAG: ArsR family transcriptional regulator [Thermoplasmata archaeon]
MERNGANDWVVRATRSYLRFQIMTVLRSGPGTPSEIARQLSVARSRVSRALRSLERMGLVTNITPGARKGRLFILSEKGKTALSALNLLTR